VGNLGFTEIMLILLVVLLLFGAKRLPEVGASIGKGIREFKRSLTDTQDAIMNEEPQAAAAARRRPAGIHIVVGRSEAAVAVTAKGRTEMRPFVVSAPRPGLRSWVARSARPAAAAAACPGCP